MWSFLYQQDFYCWIFLDPPHHIDPEMNLPPPPSYDEAVAVSQVLDLPPSYEEVLDEGLPSYDEAVSQVNV